MSLDTMREIRIAALDAAARTYEGTGVSPETVLSTARKFMDFIYGRA